ncbi:uncharacterized protein LOC143253179 isoform X2 [Tachypleus tridentatus]|uniref:uncharacterized protein LOC143253179 isoform X2 n=1 Tax=Tachypleus tridentatus TaxID=6853 RepID=UPI003FD50C41
MAVNLTTKTTEIVLKGGRPWGFQLQGGIENGDILTVSQVAHDGKAAKEGSLKVGDRVLKINDVQCFSLAEALDLINNAFRTLSILIRRNNVKQMSCISETTGYRTSTKESTKNWQKTSSFRQSMRNGTEPKNPNLNRPWLKYPITHEERTRNIPNLSDQSKLLKNQKLGNSCVSHIHHCSLSGYGIYPKDMLHSRIPVKREINYHYKKSYQIPSLLTENESLVKSCKELILRDTQYHQRSARKLTKDSGYEGEPDYANTDWLTEEGGLLRHSGSLSSGHHENDKQSMSFLSVVGQADESKNHLKDEVLKNKRILRELQYIKQPRDQLMSTKPLNLLIPSSQSQSQRDHRLSSSDSLNTWHSAASNRMVDRLPPSSQTTVNFFLDLGSADLSNIPQSNRPVCCNITHNIENKNMVTRRLNTKSVCEEFESKNGTDFSPVIQEGSGWEKREGEDDLEDTAEVSEIHPLEDFHESLDTINRKELSNQPNSFSSTVINRSPSVAGVLQNQKRESKGDESIKQPYESMKKEKKEFLELSPHQSTLSRTEITTTSLNSDTKYVSHSIVHEKFPSWPAATWVGSKIAQPVSAANYRSHSWTDQINYPKIRSCYSRPKKPFSVSNSHLTPVLERSIQSMNKDNVIGLEYEPIPPPPPVQRTLNQYSPERVQVSQVDKHPKYIPKLNESNIIQTLKENGKPEYILQNPNIKANWKKYHEFLKYSCDYTSSQSSAYGSLSSWDGPPSEYAMSLLKEERPENATSFLTKSRLECCDSSWIAKRKHKIIEVPNKTNTFVENIQNGINQEKCHSSYSDLSSLSMQMSKRSSLFDSGLSTLPDSGRFSPQSSCESNFTNTSLENGFKACLVAENEVNRENIAHSSRIQPPIRHDSQSVVYYSPDTKQEKTKDQKNSVSANDLDQQHNFKEGMDNYMNSKTQQLTNPNISLSAGIILNKQPYDFCKRFKFPKESPSSPDNNQNEISKICHQTIVSPLSESEKKAMETEFVKKNIVAPHTSEMTENRRDLSSNRQALTSNTLFSPISYLNPDKTRQMSDVELKSVQKQAVLSFYQRQKPLFSTKLKTTQPELQFSNLLNKNTVSPNDKQLQMIGASVSPILLQSSQTTSTDVLSPFGEAFDNNTPKSAQIQLSQNGTKSLSHKRGNLVYNNAHEESMAQPNSYSVPSVSGLSSRTCTINSNSSTHTNLNPMCHLKMNCEPVNSKATELSLVRENPNLDETTVEDQKNERSEINKTFSSALSIPSSVNIRGQLKGSNKLLSFQKTLRKAQLEETRDSNKVSTVTVITEDGTITLDTSDTCKAKPKTNLITTPTRLVKNSFVSASKQQCSSRSLPPISTRDQDNEYKACNNNTEREDMETERITTIQALHENTPICSSPELPLPPPPETEDTMVQPSSDPLPPPPDPFEIDMIITASTSTNPYQTFCMSHKNESKNKKHKTERSTRNVMAHRLQLYPPSKGHLPPQVKGYMKNITHQNAYSNQSASRFYDSSSSTRKHPGLRNVFEKSRENHFGKEVNAVSLLHFPESFPSQLETLSVIQCSQNDYFFNDKQESMIQHHAHYISPAFSVTPNLSEIKTSDDVTRDNNNFDCHGAITKTKTSEDSLFQDRKSTSTNKNDQSPVDLLRSDCLPFYHQFYKYSSTENSKGLTAAHVSPSQDLPSSESCISSECNNSISFSSTSGPNSLNYSLHAYTNNNCVNDLKQTLGRIDESSYQNILELRKEMTSPIYANIPLSQQIVSPSSHEFSSVDGLSSTYFNHSSVHLKKEHTSVSKDIPLNAKHKTASTYLNSSNGHKTKNDSFPVRERSLPKTNLNNLQKNEQNSITVPEGTQCTKKTIMYKDGSRVYSTNTTRLERELNFFSSTKDASLIEKKMLPVHSTDESQYKKDLNSLSFPENASPTENNMLQIFAPNDPEQEKDLNSFPVSGNASPNKNFNKNMKLLVCSCNATGHEKEFNFSIVPENPSSTENITKIKILPVYPNNNSRHKKELNFTQLPEDISTEDIARFKMSPNCSVNSSEHERELKSSPFSKDTSLTENITKYKSNKTEYEREPNSSPVLEETLSAESINGQKMSQINSDINLPSLLFQMPKETVSSIKSSTKHQMSSTYSNFSPIDEVKHSSSCVPEDLPPVFTELTTRHQAPQSYFTNFTVKEQQEENASVKEERTAHYEHNAICIPATSNTGSFSNSNRISSSTQTTKTSTSFQKQKTKEELECEKLSQAFANYCGDANLRNLLVPASNHKTMSDYLEGLFNLELERGGQPVRKITTTKITTLKDSKTTGLQTLENREEKELPPDSAYFTTSEPKAKLLNRYGKNLNYHQWASQADITEKKEELIPSIDRKLQILRAEQTVIREEMAQNESLGKDITARIEILAKPNEIDKYKLHVEEMEKIINLLLSISGRLARAQNALMCLPEDTTEKEKRVLQAKCEKLTCQYEEAWRLKESINKRSQQIAKFLLQYLSGDEYSDYEHFIKMKSKLLIDAREIDEKIKLGEEQLVALRNSINFEVCNPNLPLSMAT